MAGDRPDRERSPARPEERHRLGPEIGESPRPAVTGERQGVEQATDPRRGAVAGQQYDAESDRRREQRRADDGRLDQAGSERSLERQPDEREQRCRQLDERVPDAGDDDRPGDRTAAEPVRPVHRPRQSDRQCAPARHGVGDRRRRPVDGDPAPETKTGERRTLRGGGRDQVRRADDGDDDEPPPLDRPEPIDHVAVRCELGEHERERHDHHDRADPRPCRTRRRQVGCGPSRRGDRAACPDRQTLQAPSDGEPTRSSCRGRARPRRVGGAGSPTEVAHQQRHTGGCDRADRADATDSAPGWRRGSATRRPASHEDGRSVVADRGGDRVHRGPGPRGVEAVARLRASDRRGGDGRRVRRLVSP